MAQDQKDIKWIKEKTLEICTQGSIETNTNYLHLLLESTYKINMAVILKLDRRKIHLLPTYSYVIIEFKVMKQINKTNINASDQNGAIS